YSSFPLTLVAEWLPVSAGRRHKSRDARRVSFLRPVDLPGSTMRRTNPTVAESRAGETGKRRRWHRIRRRESSAAQAHSRRGRTGVPKILRQESLRAVLRPYRRRESRCARGLAGRARWT